jgi:hypothetical protein
MGKGKTAGYSDIADDIIIGINDDIGNIIFLI